VWGRGDIIIPKGSSPGVKGYPVSWGGGGGVWGKLVQNEQMERFSKGGGCCATRKGMGEKVKEEKKTERRVGGVLRFGKDGLSNILHIRGKNRTFKKRKVGG